MPTDDEVIAIAPCPLCTAPTGRPCHRGDGRPCGTHRDRIKAWQVRVDRERAAAVYENEVVLPTQEPHAHDTASLISKQRIAQSIQDARASFLAGESRYRDAPLVRMRAALRTIRDHPEQVTEAIESVEDLL